MPIDARIPLASRNPSIAQALELGRQDKRNSELFELGKQDRERSIRLEDDAISAQKEQQELEAQRQADEDNLRSIAVGAVEVKPLLDNIESIPRATQALQRRIENIEARGGDSSDTREVLEMVQAGRLDQARLAVDSAIQAGEAQGFIKGGQVQASARNVTSTPGTLNGQFGHTVVTRLPDGTTRSEFVPAGQGFTPTNTQGETPQQQTQRQIDEAGGTTRVKAEESRQQEIITQGQQVADTAPILKRTLDLLKVVETGGVVNQAQLKFAQTFGIETADQGELSALLGKAVLGQLRETFGAQFTQQEGDRLAEIEAGFGKNNATNTRLLQQALAIVEAKANRAIKLARANDDEVTAQIIEDAMNLSLSDDSDDDAKLKELGL